MKKQKKPIILVLALAILFGGVAFMNRPQPKDGEVPPQQQPEAPKEDSKELANNVGSNLESTKPTPAVGSGEMKPHGNHGRPVGPPGMPSMLKAPMTYAKPKPSGSSTSTQWYTDETNKK